MAHFNKVQDSGKRQQFQTGSQRDTDDGKGQPHLLPGEVMQDIEAFFGDRLQEYDYQDNPKKILYDLVYNLYDYGIVRSQPFPLTLIDVLENIIIYIAYQEEKHYTDAFRRLAIHYQNGAKKYNKNNWRKGQPISRYYDSAIRHAWAEQAGKKDEDHASAIFWNIVAIIQTKKDIKKGLLLKELDDFPFIIKDVFGEKNDIK